MGDDMNANAKVIKVTPKPAQSTNGKTLVELTLKWGSHPKRWVTVPDTGFRKNELVYYDSQQGTVTRLIQADSQQPA